MKFTALKRVGMKTLNTLKKASPDICFWGGMGLAVVGTVVLAVRSSRLEEEVEDRKSEIAQTREQENKMEPKVYRKELAKGYFRMGKDIASELALPVGLLAVGYTGMAFGHITLKKENAALVGALGMAYKSIDSLKASLVKELGEDKAHDILNDIKEEKRVEVCTNEKGKEFNKEVADRKFDTPVNNPAAITFEECTCGCATNDPWYNLNFLRQIEKEFQKILDIDKQPVFINDIYRRLGHRKTKYGQLNGFMPGDVIKLGFDDFRNPGAEAFMAQDQAEVVLTFTGRGGTIPHYIIDEAF